MNKRKILTLAMTLCMVAILAIGGTLAYFTDTEQKTNTMVFGNITINLEELAYENGAFKDFEDDKFVLYPIDNEQGDALRNKMVYTFNTSASKDDAYIRTIVLIEKNDEITAENETDCCFPGIHYGFAINERTAATETKKGYVGSADTGLDSKVTATTVTINEEDYYVVVFEAKDKKAISYNQALQSLSEIWVDEDVTNEQIAGWGDKISVIAFSQGIQATGLTHAQAMEELGEVSAENLESWITQDDAKINDIFQY